MLDLVKGETERIDARFLEPACGSGNFLVPILQRKLGAVELKFGKSEFEKRHYALLAVMCAYGAKIARRNTLRPMRGFRDLSSAKATLKGLEAFRAIRKAEFDGATRGVTQFAQPRTLHSSLISSKTPPEIADAESRQPR